MKKKNKIKVINIVKKSTQKIYIDASASEIKSNNSRHIYFWI